MDIRVHARTKLAGVESGDAEEGKMEPPWTAISMRKVKG